MVLSFAQWPEDHDQFNTDLLSLLMYVNFVVSEQQVTICMKRQQYRVSRKFIFFSVLLLPWMHLPIRISVFIQPPAYSLSLISYRIRTPNNACLGYGSGIYSPMMFFTVKDTCHPVALAVCLLCSLSFYRQRREI